MNTITFGQVTPLSKRDSAEGLFNIAIKRSNGEFGRLPAAMVEFYQDDLYKKGVSKGFVVITNKDNPDYDEFIALHNACKKDKILEKYCEPYHSEKELNHYYFPDKFNYAGNTDDDEYDDSMNKLLNRWT